MSIDRARVRALVRAELEKRLDEEPPVRVHAALLEIYQGPAPGWSEDVDSGIRKPCIIEPDRPCTNSGYCQKLGH
jgi:hypothetical protein